MDVFRIFDAMNDIRNVETAIAAVKTAGSTLRALCYATSPVHGPELFVEQAQAMAARGAIPSRSRIWRGFSPPRRPLRWSATKKAVDLPVALHSHSTSGLAPCAS